MWETLYLILGHSSLLDTIAFESLGLGLIHMFIFSPENMYLICFEYSLLEEPVLGTMELDTNWKDRLCPYQVYCVVGKEKKSAQKLPSRHYTCDQCWGPEGDSPSGPRQAESRWSDGGTECRWPYAKALTWVGASVSELMKSRFNDWNWVREDESPRRRQTGDQGEVSRLLVMVSTWTLWTRNSLSI